MIKCVQYCVLITLILSFFTGEALSQPIDVVESTIKVGGLNEESMYYGFAAGDRLIFDFQEINEKEIKQVEIIEMPSSVKFSDFKTFKVQKELIIPQTAIYRFRFVNTALGGRICKIKIQRVPMNEATKNFNTTVYWRTLYDTTYTVAQERYLVKKEYKPQRIIKEKHYINSGSNATFKDGKSRISVSVPLPRNTVQWYYVFSSSRNEQELNNTHSSINLLGDITKIIDVSGIANLGIQMLTQPPGGNPCDIYVTDITNAQLFEQKVVYNYYPNYSRENITSGIIQVSQLNLANPYICIKNPDSFYGINISLEVVAITLDEQWGIREIKHPNITSRNEAYLIVN